jgi:NADH-quinone oxidoreductase subunit K
MPFVPGSFDIQTALVFAALMLGIGLWGLMRRRNMLLVLMSLELVFAASVVAFVAVSHHVRTYNGQIFAVFVIMVAAAQAAIGVGLLVGLYRHRNSISTQHWTGLKG